MAIKYLITTIKIATLEDLNVSNIKINNSKILYEEHY